MQTLCIYIFSILESVFLQLLFNVMENLNFLKFYDLILGMENNYKEKIQDKISKLKNLYPFLKQKSDDFCFFVVCMNCDYYANPYLTFNDEVIQESIIDGPNDGGADIIFLDPSDDGARNLVICQSKYWESINADELCDALSKLVNFYKQLTNGQFNDFQDRVVSRFQTLFSEIGEESKIIFVIYTKADKLNKSSITKVDSCFRNFNLDSSKFEFRLLFNEDICEKIKDQESRRPSVDSGKIIIDESENYLKYNNEEDAIIVNTSAFSIKELYAKNTINLLSMNLRYHIKTSLDKEIKESIQKEPAYFWYKNNGLIILCDNFEIDGREIKLTNFSVVNGGQTTYNLFKSNSLTKDKDFYLQCKIIRIKGDSEDDKRKFALEIAKATNSQKAIKPIDLKANAPEQVRFIEAMKACGIFYQTKRGEKIPNEFKKTYLNTDLNDTGKLCMIGIFQLPARSRNRPSDLYKDEYYNLIFNNDQAKIARIVQQLLYMNYYFTETFINKYIKDEAERSPNKTTLVPLARNARTICVAFASFAARYLLDEKGMCDILNEVFESNLESSEIYKKFSDISAIKDSLFPTNLFRDKDKFDEVLYILYKEIIKRAHMLYQSSKGNDASLNESNFLKKDANYYQTLKIYWDDLQPKVDEVKKIILSKN